MSARWRRHRNRQAGCPSLAVVDDRDGRLDLATILRASVLHGFHEGIDNHVSLAVPGSADRFLLNPTAPLVRAAGQRPDRGRRRRTRRGAGRGRADRVLAPLAPPTGPAPTPPASSTRHMPYATALALTRPASTPSSTRTPCATTAGYSFHEE